MTFSLESPRTGNPDPVESAVGCHCEDGTVDASYHNSPEGRCVSCTDCNGSGEVPRRITRNFLEVNTFGY